MKTYGGVEVLIHAFLNSALDEGSLSGRFSPRGGAPGTHWIAGWRGARSCLDVMSK